LYLAGCDRCDQPGDRNAVTADGDLLIVACSISGDSPGALSRRILPFLAILLKIN
jgi:hypothetical protein